MCLNLRNRQLKINYVHRLLYVGLMVTTNQNSIIDTQKIKRKEYKHNTKESHQIRKEARKRKRRRNREQQKQSENN